MKSDELTTGFSRPNRRDDCGVTRTECP
jgi:hypothetical protein